MEYLRMFLPIVPRLTGRDLPTFPNDGRFAKSKESVNAGSLSVAWLPKHMRCIQSSSFTAKKAPKSKSAQSKMNKDIIVFLLRVVHNLQPSSSSTQEYPRVLLSMSCCCLLML